MLKNSNDARHHIPSRGSSAGGFKLFADFPSHMRVS